MVTFCHPVGGWLGISLPIYFKTTVDTLSLSFPNDLSWKNNMIKKKKLVNISIRNQSYMDDFRMTFHTQMGGWVGVSLPICFKTTVDTLSLSFPNDLSWKKQYDLKKKKASEYLN